MRYMVTVISIFAIGLVLPYFGIGFRVSLIPMLFILGLVGCLWLARQEDDYAAQVRKED